MPEMQWIIEYLLLGLFIGYFSGLLGIGGGVLLVPILVFMFEAQHFAAQNVFHLALGTSMATIIFTSLSSARQHHAHQAVVWNLFAIITPGILIGTALGAIIVGYVSALYLTLFFALFVYAVAIQMLLELMPAATRGYPTRKEITVAGTVIGCISSMVSIGGGMLSVPYMIWHKLPLRNAIATSAAIGFPIAVGGTLGYIYNGWHATDLPRYSLGYVYTPALLWLVIGTISTAPFGARATHRMPVPMLRKIFAVVLILLATKMLLKVIL